MLHGACALRKGDGCGRLVRFGGLTGGYATNRVCVAASGIVLDGLPEEPPEGGRSLARLVRYRESHPHCLCHSKFTGSSNLPMKRICQLAAASGRLPPVVQQGWR